MALGTTDEVVEQIEVKCFSQNVLTHDQKTARLVKTLPSQSPVIKTGTGNGFPPESYCCWPEPELPRSFLSQFPEQADPFLKYFVALVCSSSLVGRREELLSLFLFFLSAEVAI